MTPTLTSRLTRENLDTVIAEVERQDRLTLDAARELMAAVAIPIFAIETNWQSIQTLLDHGAEGRKLTFLLKEFLDVVQISIKGFSAIQTKLADVQLTGADAQDASKIASALARVREMEAELVPLIRWLDAPRTEIDPASLPSAGCSPTAEGFISMDELKSRLLSDS